MKKIIYLGLFLLGTASIASAMDEKDNNTSKMNEREMGTTPSLRNSSSSLEDSTIEIDENDSSAQMQMETSSSEEKKESELTYLQRLDQDANNLQTRWQNAPDRASKETLKQELCQKHKNSEGIIPGMNNLLDTFNRVKIGTVNGQFTGEETMKSFEETQRLLNKDIQKFKDDFEPIHQALDALHDTAHDELDPKQFSETQNNGMDGAARQIFQDGQNSNQAPQIMRIPGSNNIVIQLPMYLHPQQQNPAPQNPQGGTSSPQRQNDGNEQVIECVQQ